jgi:uncharacterized protein YndB with AHSA1/START domain
MADKTPAGAKPVQPGTGGLVTIVDSGPMIIATVRLPGCEASQALAAFTDRAVLAHWWRGELTTDLVPGGEYCVSFPAIGARLTGRVIRYAPGRSLEFSWAWDGDGGPPSTVSVRAESVPDGGAVALIVEHGPHDDDEAGRTAHDEHWAGWEFFLPRLPAAVGI